MKIKKPSPRTLKLYRDKQQTITSDTVQSPLELFLLAAETMENKTDPKVALHDHTYARPPMDLEGSSGLQLIAAAAAVVSPGLSRSAGSGKTPVLSPVKALRGRPPNQQKRGSSHAGQKLAPTLLTPTSGVSQHVPLQDIKPPIRARSRSASTDRPRPMIHASRPTPVSVHLGGRAVSGAAAVKQLTIAKGKDGVATGLFKTNGGQGLDALVNVAITSQADGQHSIGNGNFLTQSLLTSVANNKGLSITPNPKKDGSNTVLEVNLGNMALLLAANQQPAALLLPTLGKLPLNNNALASLLQSSGAVVSLSESPNSQSFSLNQTGLHSRGSGNTVLHIPRITPEMLTKVTVPASSSTQSSSLRSVSSAPATPVSEFNPLATAPINAALHISQSESSSKHHSSASIPSNRTSNHTPNHTSNLTPTSSRSSSSQSSVPTSDDLSNLNLLSALVAGLPPSSKKSTTSTHVSSSSTLHTAQSTISSSVSLTPQVSVSSSSATTPVPLSISHTHTTSTTSSSSSTVASPSSTAPLSHNTISSTSSLATTSSLVTDRAVSGSTPKPSPPLSNIRSVSSQPSSHAVMTCGSPKETKTTVSKHSPSLRENRGEAVSTIHSDREWLKSERQQQDMSSTSSLSALSQESLMLYTSSLSLSKHSSDDSSSEEDHLECATRGISELSKLLGGGTDNGMESPATNENMNSVTKTWNPDDLLVSPVHHNQEQPSSSDSFKSSLAEGSLRISTPTDATLRNTPLFTNNSITACSTHHTSSIANQ